MFTITLGTFVDQHTIVRNDMPNHIVLYQFSIPEDKLQFCVLIGKKGERFVKRNRSKSTPQLTYINLRALWFNIAINESIFYSKQSFLVIL
jgi:hypothetical protein